MSNTRSGCYVLRGRRRRMDACVIYSSVYTCICLRPSGRYRKCHDSRLLPHAQYNYYHHHHHRHQQSCHFLAEIQRSSGVCGGVAPMRTCINLYTRLHATSRLLGLVTTTQLMPTTTITHAASEWSHLRIILRRNAFLPIYLPHTLFFRPRNRFR